jgi:protein required for attachment to host cells
MRRPVIWILVADGTRARAILAPATAGAREPMATMLELHAEHRPAREIMADAPGRTFASVGARRSAMEYHSDPVRGELERFARAIVDELEARRAAGGFERLVVYAPPRMLGAMRDAMPEKLAAVVQHELAKDLTKLPELELRRIVEELLANRG